MQVFCNWSINCWNFVSGSSAPSIGSARSLASPVPEVCGGCTGLQWVLHSWLGRVSWMVVVSIAWTGEESSSFRALCRQEGGSEGRRQGEEGRKKMETLVAAACPPAYFNPDAFSETSQDKQDRCCRPICMLLLFAKRLFCPAASGPFSFPQILVVSICFDPLVLLLLFFHVLSYPLLRFFPRVQSIRYPKQ